MVAAGGVTLIGLYLVAVGMLLASRVREFADETDNLLGGLLITRGSRLYVDFFSSHMPVAYYVAAVPALLGATTLEQFRVFSQLLLIGATLAVVWVFRNSLSLVLLGLWATISVFAHTLQWGEMLTASTCAGYGVLLAGLLFYTTPGLRFSWRQQLLLSAAIFLAVQSELVAIFPILLLGLCLVAVRLRDLRGLVSLLAIVAAPHVAMLLAMRLSGELADFAYYAYQFNQLYYAQFVMNPSVAGMLHDWEAQYRTYVRLSLQNPLGWNACLVLANVVAAGLVSRSRGLLVGAIYYVFVALTHVRNEGAYYLCSYFSLALDLTWAIGCLRSRSRRWQLVLPGLVLLLGANFVTQVGLTYDLSRRPARNEPDVAIVASITVPGERILVVPFDQYVYLAANRMPASMFSYYLPWHAIDPRIDARLRDDLRAERPPVVIFRGDELVNGQWLPRQYASGLYDFLAAQGYVPLDASSPLLGDVLVRKDRLMAARESLATGQPVQAPATQ
ncbi:MAG: hypothetical protein ACR2IK_01645 [Chloroflexota bacterium]